MSCMYSICDISWLWLDFDRQILINTISFRSILSTFKMQKCISPGAEHFTDIFIANNLGFKKKYISVDTFWPLVTSVLNDWLFPTSFLWCCENSDTFAHYHGLKAPYLLIGANRSFIPGASLQTQNFLSVTRPREGGTSAMAGLSG